MKKLLLYILCLALIVTNTATVFAEEEDNSLLPMTIMGSTELNAITDYSTYGATDILEMSDVTHIGSVGFADVTDKKLAKVTAFLQEMGIMNGIGDSKFGPDELYTRVQFVITICRMLNVNVDSFAADSNQFYDIPADYEFKSYIDVAASMGLIQGFTDKTFKPETVISFEDAVAILLRTMGYELSAESKGGYPYGYIRQASELNIDDGVKIGENGTITRANAAMLIYNCLHAQVVEVYKGNNITQLAGQKTMLEYYQNVYFDSGKVNATYLTGIDGNNKVRSNEVKIGDVVYKCKENMCSEYLGYSVRVYYKEDNETGDKNVKCLYLTGDYEEIIVTAKDIVGYSDGKFTYYENNKRRTISIDAGHELIYNGQKIADYDKTIFAPGCGYVRLIKTNTASTEYDMVFVNEYFNFYVDSVSALGSVITIGSPYCESMEIDLGDKDILMELYDKEGRMDSSLTVSTAFDNDGNEIKKYSVPPIPKKSIISVFADKFEKKADGHYKLSNDAKYIKIQINDATLDTSILSQNISDGTITTEKGTFDIARDNFLFEDVEELPLNSDITLLFDFDGNVTMFTTTEKSKYEYGYLINATAVGSLKSTYQLKILRTNGQILIYDCIDNFKINDVKVKNAKDFKNKLRTSAQYTNPTFEVSQLIKYQLNDDKKVVDIKTVTASVGVDPNYPEDQLRREAERAKYTTPEYFGGTLGRDIPINYGVSGIKTQRMSMFGKPNYVFVVPEAETFDDTNYGVKNGTFTIENALGDVYDADDYLIPQVLVLYESVTVSELTTPFVIVKKVIDKVDEDGIYTRVLSCIDGFRELEYSGDNPNVFNGLKEGDIVMLFGKNSEVTQCKVIATVEEILNHDYSQEYERRDQDGYMLSMAEVYDYNTAGRTYVLQTGDDSDGDGKRSFQRISFWSDIASTFKHGSITCTVTDDGKYKFTVNSASDIKSVKKYGHQKSSKIFVAEQNYYSLRFFVIVNDCR